MTKYLKITDAILDEAFIEEDKVALPELTADMQVNWNITLCLYIQDLVCHRNRNYPAFGLTLIFLLEDGTQMVHTFGKTVKIYILMLCYFIYMVLQSISWKCC